MFIHEKPLGPKDEDELGRENYAKHLAASFSSYIDNEKSLVIGLYGAWGSGKTSLWSLIQRNIDKEKTLVVEFEPWEFSNQDTIFQAFFVKLYDAIKFEDRKLANKIISHFRTLLRGSNSIFLKIQDNFDKIYTAIASVGFLIGLSSLTDAYKSIALSIIFLLVAMASGLLWTLDKFQFLPCNDIKKAKTRLSEAIETFFKGKGKNLLIVIDDIDRLPPEQIKLIFQIIQVNANFPRTLYLLPFDRKVIEDTLHDEENGISGSEYLEKIVQVGLDVPAIDILFLHTYAETKIIQILVNRGIFSYLDEQRWGRLFGGHLCFYFEDLRDTKRFINSLDFHISFVNQQECEIDLVDFITMEIFRIFEPRLYKLLPEHRSFFSYGARIIDKAHIQRHYHSLNQQYPDDTESRTYFINLIRDNSNIDERHVFEIINEIFPATKSIFKGSSNGYSSAVSEAFEKRRVAHSYNFDWYFQYQNPSGLSKQQIKEIYEQAGDFDYLSNKLRELHSSMKLHTAMYFLEISTNQLSVSDTEPFVCALLSIEWELEVKKNALETSTQDLIYRIITKVLHQNILVESRRAEIFISSIEKSKALFIPLYLVSAYRNHYRQPESRRRESIQPLIFGESITEKLTGWLWDRVKRELDLSNGQLRQHKALAQMLYLMRDWGKSDTLNEWANKLISEEKGFWELTKSFAKSTYSDNNLDSLHLYVDIENLKKKVRENNSSTGLSSEEQDILRILRANYISDENLAD